MNLIQIGATVGGAVGLTGSCVLGTIFGLAAPEGSIPKCIAGFGVVAVPGGAAIGAGLGWLVNRVF